MNKWQPTDTAGIKLETVLTSKDEEVLLAKGWTQPDWGRGRRGAKTATRGFGVRPRMEKKINPTNDKGETLVCPSCGSFRHLLADCPDSYENMKKNRVFAVAAEEETSKEEGSCLHQTSKRA